MYTFDHMPESAQNMKIMDTAYKDQTYSYEYQDNMKGDNQGYWGKKGRSK